MKPSADDSSLAATRTPPRPTETPDDTRLPAVGSGKTCINDLDLRQWKRYPDLLTDSLWLLEERDKSGAHRGDYHGNFIPQIPNQLMRRFTRKGDVVLDPFLGSGTTLIECRRLGRNGIGVELLEDVAEMARSRIVQGDASDADVFTEVVTADSATRHARKEVERLLAEHGRRNVQMLILHPPYHGIIRFSKAPADLSNAGSVEDFLQRFGEVVDNFLDLLESRHYLAVVIGDEYLNAEWVPLGFLAMNELLKRGTLTLKSIVVKNMVNNRAKRNLENLWRYRALVGGFYVFRHEYIMLFRKR